MLIQWNREIIFKLSDEMLGGERFYALREAKVLIERWRIHYNSVRSHNSLGYRPSVPQAIQIAPPLAGCAPLDPLTTQRPPPSSVQSAAGLT